MKSRVLPKCCVNIDRYQFFHGFLCFLFFSKVVTKWDFNKWKKKNLRFFPTKLKFLVRYRFWVSKMEKSDFFLFLFLKCEKSYFANIVRKRWLVSFFNLFFKVYIIFSQNGVEMWFKKWKKKIFVFFWQN